jgi:hypothetical protein
MIPLLFALLVSMQVSPLPGVKVGGYVVPSDPARAHLLRSVVLIRGATSLRAPIGPDRAFEFAKVPPGAYDVFVDDVGMTPDTIRLTGMPPVRVIVRDVDITGFRLVTPRRVVVEGTARLEGVALMPSFSLSFTNTSGATPFSDTVGGGGSFYFQLYPGEYRVTAAGVPAGFAVRSITAGQVDLRTQTLTVTADGSPKLAVTLGLDSAFSSPFVQIRGRLTGGNSGTYAGAHIVMSSSVLAGYLTASASADGTFHFPMALPGTYAVDIYSMPETLGAPAISLGVGNSDLTNLELPIPVWQEVMGRVVLDNAGTMPRFISFALAFPNGAALMANGRAAAVARNLAPGTVVVTPLGFLPRSAPLQPDGRFKVTLPEGERRFRLEASSAPPGYVLTAATYGTTDILTGPITIAGGDTAELVLRFERRNAPSAR